MTMDWKECLNKRIAKDVNSDANLIDSLIQTSENKLKSEKELKMSNVTSSSKVSLAYDSLRELLEALSLKKGFKIYNHECYTPFLKEILNESEAGDEFDAIRKIRNNINYYGGHISPEEAEEVISKIEALRDFALKLLKKL